MEVFLTLPIDAKIATLASHTDAKDPDELLKRGGWTCCGAIADATELLEYRIGRLRAGLPAPARLRPNAIREGAITRRRSVSRRLTRSAGNS